MNMKKVTNKDKILLVASGVILAAIAVFLIAFWDTAIELTGKLLGGVELVEGYIKALGLPGIAAMMLIMVVCFFFPVISSMPIQLACGVTYGIWGGGGIILCALYIASQMLYLFRQNLKILSSPKQVQKRLELEKMISESDRNIYVALIIAYLLPGVPFLVINNLAASVLSYRKYSLVTLLGMLPDIFTTIFLGEKLLSSSPVASIVTLIAIVLLIVLSIVFNNRLITWFFTSKRKK